MKYKGLVSLTIIVKMGTSLLYGVAVLLCICLSFFEISLLIFLQVFLLGILRHCYDF